MKLPLMKVQFFVSSEIVAFLLKCFTFIFLEFETYLKTKIEKLSQIETKPLEGKSLDHHEQFSTKSMDESRASLYFTPTDGHLSPQPMQDSPIHINYINENMIGCENANNKSSWRFRNPLHNARNNFFFPIHLGTNFLTENTTDIHGSFIIPEQIYNDEVYNLSCDQFDDLNFKPIPIPSEAFQDSAMPSTSVASMPSTSGYNNHRKQRRHREKDRRRARNTVENENLLMQEMMEGGRNKGARSKAYEFQHYDHNSGN